ncbi:MAG TPA: hypothetical protein VNO23_04710 [Candidatus Binatia bacterium]|nr:hypothetical protein [Candidatus Binatia bacterium]
MSAARALVGLLEDLERAGLTVMDLVRAGQPAEPWRIYPDDNGIFDRRTGCQFYYHSHDDGRDEDGHFHTVRLFPDRTVHIAAISMAADGWPRALFTVNLWAIGDAWEPPERIKTYARRFRIDRHRGPADLVRFVNLMFRAFLPEIERLQDDNASRLAAHHARYPDRNPFEDRTREIPSWIDVDLRRRAGAADRTA